MKTLIYLMSSFGLIYSISLFIFGKSVSYKLPKNMKNLFAYHSSISDKNYDNFLTAQRIYGNICLKTSYIILPINIILGTLFFLFIKQENIIIMAFLMLIIFDIISLLIARFMTEKQLKDL